jgi:hypothetical protein
MMRLVGHAAFLWEMDYKPYIHNFSRNTWMEDLVEDGRMVIEWILNKYDTRICLNGHFADYKVRKSFYELKVRVHPPKYVGDWRALVFMVMNLRVPWKAENLLSIWAISSFPRWALLCAVSYPISTWLCNSMRSGRLLFSLVFWQQANTEHTLPRILLKWHAWYTYRVFTVQFWCYRKANYGRYVETQFIKLLMVLSRVRDSVTNNYGFWIGWLHLLALLLQLQSIITPHNRWLPKTRSILPGLLVSSLLLWLTSIWFTNWSLD